MENLTLKSNHRGNLNINSISNKFDNWKLIIQGKIDIWVITETKTDSAFPLNQFAIQGYSKPYRFDKNRKGGGAFTYIREDIPSTELKIHKTQSILKVFLSKLIWLKLGGFFVVANTHLASLTNTSLKILEKR